MRIALIIVSFIAIFFAIRSYKLSSQNIELSSMILSDKIKDLGQDEMIKESFLKFVSDSREWAFAYIEEVQNGLEKFVNEVDHHIKHFDEYGSVLSEERPDYLAMKQISKSYKELKELLPKTERNI